MKRRTITTEEKQVAEGVIIKHVQGDMFDHYSLNPGDKIKIARVIRTPMGLSYRVMFSTRWLHEDQIDIEVPSSQIFDYTGTRPEEAVPESWPNAQKKTAQKRNINKKIEAGLGPAPILTAEKKTDIFKEKKSGGSKRREDVLKYLSVNKENQTKTRIRNVIINNEPIKDRLKGILGMNKKDLRRALESINTNETFTIAFLHDRESLSGTYTMLRTKAGRGKGGSLLAEIKSAATGEVLVVGTPDSDFVLNVIKANGEMIGHMSLDDVPPTFETSEDNAKLLKDKLKTLIERCAQLPKVNQDDTRTRYKPLEPTTMVVNSTHEPINGSLQLVEMELKRGRHGKVIVSAVNSNGTKVLVDSFQHSGVISSLTFSS